MEKLGDSGDDSENNQINDGKVELADRADVLRLATFLDDLLPDYCALHNTVLSALSSPAIRIYFIRHPSTSADYLAVVGLKEERSNTIERPKMWHMTYWFTDEHSLLSIYKSFHFIDWLRDDLYVYPFDPERESFLSNYINRFGRTLQTEHFDQYTMDVRMALNIRIDAPNGVSVKNLERQHGQIVCDLWTYHRSYAVVEDVADDIERFHSVGVFIDGEDQPVSWVMNYPPWGISRLHTREEHRRRGYAKLAVQFLARRLAQAGYFPSLNITAGNVDSINLHTAAGFQFRRKVTALEFAPA